MYGLHKASKEGLCMVYIKLVKRGCVWFLIHDFRDCDTFIFLEPLEPHNSFDSHMNHTIQKQFSRGIL